MSITKRSPAFNEYMQELPPKESAQEIFAGIERKDYYYEK